jgi:pyruvyltransferase
VKVYWSRCGHGHGNFGDKLTPLLLKHFGVPIEWAAVEHAELIGVGSILEKVPEGFKGVIWTSGFMHESSRGNFPSARVLGVRGRLTRERIACKDREQIVLGDAGLLCDEFAVRRRKRYKLGIIPHFVDAEDELVRTFAASSSDITIVDICGPTLEVIRAVGECEQIISSSLHGLILADSLGIPNCWLELNRGPERVAGKGFKYRDYYSVFGIAPEPLRLDRSMTLEDVLRDMPPYGRPNLETIKESLRRTIERIKESVRPVSARELAARRAAEADWQHQLGELRRLVSEHIPEGATVLVADNDQLRSELPTIRSVPFLERNGLYWGAPGSSEEAIAEVTRQLERGIRWVIIAWPLAWLLDRFPDFASYLNSNMALRSHTTAGWIFERP